MLLDGARDVRGDIALGLAQRDNEEDRRLSLTHVCEAAHVFPDVADLLGIDTRGRLVRRRAVATLRGHLPCIPLAVPAAGDAQDLDVCLEGFQRPEDGEEA